MFFLPQKEAVPLAITPILFPLSPPYPCVGLFLDQLLCVRGQTKKNSTEVFVSNCFLCS